MSLAARLRLFLSLVALALLAFGVIAYVRLAAFEEKLATIFDSRIPTTRLLCELSDLHAVHAIDAVAKVTVGKLTPAEAATTLQHTQSEIARAWSLIRQSGAGSALEVHFADAQRLLADAGHAIDAARAALDSGDPTSLADHLSRRLYPAIDPLTVRLRTMLSDYMAETDASIVATRAQVSESRRLGSVAIGSGSAVILFIGLHTARRIVRALAAIARVVHAAAAGDLSRRIRLRGRDELAVMAADIDAMIDSLETSQKNLRDDAIALAESGRQARAASAAKSMFLSGMSHELRTPLNVILGYAQILQRAPGRAPEERRDLARIAQAGDHLLGLIDDVLSIARAEAGKLTLRPTTFSPSDILHSVGGMLQVRARAKGLRLEVDCSPRVPPYAEGDAHKLRQVLVNLVGNAVKFTAEGSVRATFDFADGRLLASVSDTGPGIAPDEQSRLFQTFFQGAAGIASAEGTGLGLHISQTLVRLMGGEITLHSTVGTGSTFSFSIPLLPAGRAATPASAYEHARLPPGLTLAPMLVVDDREANREVLARVLADIGADAVQAATGESALEQAARHRFSVIWMDLRMPGIDGWETLRRLRAAEGDGARTPVVAITASVIDLDRDTARRSGFDDLISKPFTAAGICRCIEELLGISLVLPPAAATDADPPADDLATAVAALPLAARLHLLRHLVTGDNEGALAALEAVQSPSASAALRPIIESYQVDGLIDALRAAGTASPPPP